MAKTPAPTSGGSSFLTRKSIGGMPNWVLLAGGGVLIYILVSKKSSTTTSTAATTVPTSGIPAQGSASQIPVYVLQPSGGSSGGSSGGTSKSSGTPNSGGGTPNSGDGTPGATTPTESTAGYGQQMIGGTQYTLLGYKTGGGSAPYPGYNVGGGAPVFYLAPGSTTPTQGFGQAVPSAEVLTPSAYDSWVSPKPVSNA